MDYTWGLYGDLKYLNGKIRIGFQRRSANKNDKFLYENGLYYAYCDDPAGLTQWKDAFGKEFETPMWNSELIKIAEPGDWVNTTQKDKVRINGGFDFTVTNAGDEHFLRKMLIFRMLKLESTLFGKMAFLLVACKGLLLWVKMITF